MATFEIFEYGDGSFGVRETTYDEPLDMPGFDKMVQISSVLCYLLAFVGMILMLGNLPSSMIFPGILAVGVFLVPAVLALFGQRSLVAMLRRITLVAYLPFNIMVGMWWMLWGAGTASAELLIGLLVVVMYAIYYFPILLIYDGIRRETKLGVVGAVCSFVAAVTVFLVLYGVLGDTSAMGDHLPVIFPSAITVIGTLFLFVSRAVYWVREGAKVWHTLILPAVYILIVAVVAVLAFAVFPAERAERYEAAMQCAENGDYRAAREQLAALGDFRDAAAQYEAIRFTDLQPGERVIMGAQADAPGEFGENPLSWTVIAVKDGKALLLSDDILTSILAPSSFSLKERSEVRRTLKALELLFDEAELARMQTFAYELTVDGEAEQLTDKLFLPSRAELEQYCKAAQIFAGSDTSYNDHQILDYQMEDLDYSYVYTYFTRDVSEDGKWILADCDAKAFVTWEREYRYVGVRPAMYVAVDTAE